MILAGILTVLAFGFLTVKMGWPFIQKIIGHQVAADVIITVFFMWLFGITGTISGMMTGIVAGLFVSIILFIASKFITHKKFEKTDDGVQWVDKPGEWVGQFINKIPTREAEKPPSEWFK